MSPSFLQLALFGCLSLTLLPAQGGSGAQAKLVAKRDKKLQEAFIKKVPWITDYDKARAEAKKSGKVLFAYFTRSYSP